MSVHTVNFQMTISKSINIFQNAYADLGSIYEFQFLGDNYLVNQYFSFEIDRLMHINQ